MLSGFVYLMISHSHFWHAETCGTNSLIANFKGFERTMQVYSVATYPHAPVPTQYSLVNKSLVGLLEWKRHIIWLHSFCHLVPILTMSWMITNLKRSRVPRNLRVNIPIDTYEIILSFFYNEVNVVIICWRKLCRQRRQGQIKIWRCGKWRASHCIRAQSFIIQWLSSNGISKPGLSILRYCRFSNTWMPLRSDTCQCFDWSLSF